LVGRKPVRKQKKKRIKSQDLEREWERERERERDVGVEINASYLNLVVKYNVFRMRDLVKGDQ